MRRWLVYSLAVWILGCAGDPVDETAQLDQALLSETPCEEQTLAWTSESSKTEACTGPWLYRHNYSCQYRGPDCDNHAYESHPRTCTEYPSCRRWEHGADRLTTAWSTTSVGFKHGPHDGDPELGGWNRCRNRGLSAYHGLPNPKRLVRVDVQVELHRADQIDGTQFTAYAYECRYRVAYEVPRLASNQACCTGGAACTNCAEWTCSGFHQSCSRPWSGGIIPWWGPAFPAQYSAMGLSETEFRTWFELSNPPERLRGTPVCFSCDHIPLSKLDQKLQCLQSNFGTARLDAAGGMFSSPVPAARPRVALLARLLKQLFEHRYDQLSEDHRALVRGLYHDELLVELDASGVAAHSTAPTCGVTREVDELCNGQPALPVALDGTLDYCARLTSGHVSSTARMDEYDGICLPAFDELADVIANAGCPLPAHHADAEAILDHYLYRGSEDLEATLAGIPSLTNETHHAAAIAAFIDYFRHLDGWFGAMLRYATTEDVDELLAANAASFWRLVHDQRYRATEQESAADALLEAATEDLAIDGLRIDQLVLRAAYANSTPRPLSGAPLLLVTGEALAGLVDRLDVLGDFADIGCAMRDCARRSETTPLARLWSLLANLGDPQVVAQLSAASPDALAGWKATFTDISPRLTRLQAELDALEGGPVPPPALRLVEQIVRAQTRSSAYQAGGTFGVLAGRHLRTPLHGDARAALVSLLAQVTTQLRDKERDFEEDLRDTVRAIVDREGNAANLAIVETRLASRSEQLDELNGRLVAHVSALDEEITSGLEGAVELATEATGDAAVLELASLHADMQLSAQDAHFTGWRATDVTDIAVGPPTAVARGHVLAVLASGLWAPSCAVRDTTIFDEHGNVDVAGNHVDLNQALVGPEGYTASTVAQAFGSSTTSNATRFTVGVKGEVCNNGGLFGRAAEATTGWSYNVCAYSALDWTRTSTDSTGTQQQTSIGFASGLFLPNTPIPFAPAGSLVIVEMPPGETALSGARDYHLVRSPMTTVPVTGDGDFYLVVNDRACEGRDGLNRLTVQIKQLASAAAVGDAFLAGVTAAVEEISARRPGLLARGELMPHEAAELRAAARQRALAEAPVPIPISAYPPALREVYELYEARAITRLEHYIRAANLDRDIALLNLELQAIETELAHGERRQYLLDSLPRWSLRSLRSDHLKTWGMAVAVLIRDYLRPVLELWYPSVASSLENNLKARDLAWMSIETRVVDAVSKVTALSQEVQLAIEQGADHAWRGAGQPPVTKTVIVEVPNAEVPAPCFFNCPPPPFVQLSDELSRDLWDALREQLAQPTGSRPIALELSPEWVYRANGGTSVLECSQELPVVRHIGLAFRNSDPHAIDQNTLDRTVSVRLAGSQRFVSAGGDHLLQVTEAGMKRIVDIPVFFAQPEQVVPEFNKKIRPPHGSGTAARIIGLSPFAALTIELPASAATWDLTTANAMYLVMEIESMPTIGAAPVTGAPGQCDGL